MKKTNTFERKKISNLALAFFSMLFYFFFLLPDVTNGNAIDSKHATNSTTIRETRNTMEKKNMVNQKPDNNDNNKVQENILDDYKNIKDFYAYDPVTQEWVQIKSFKIIQDYQQDYKPDLAATLESYMAFWAYNATDQGWYKVSLIKYLQQTDTQQTNVTINDDSATISIKKQVLSDNRNELNSPSNDELLEELLGVHTPTADRTAPMGDRMWWSNFSFDFTLGTGAVFYQNSLVNMGFIKKSSQECLLITNGGEMYKQNWFYHTLNRVNKSGAKGITILPKNNNISFKGKGSAIPITLGVQYTFWEQLIVGVGRELIFNYTTKLVHSNTSTTLSLHKTWSAQGRWFAKCGWYCFNNESHRLFVDIRLFYVHHLGNMLRKTITFGSYLHQAAAYNIGFGYEQQVTDCFSLTSRLAVEWQRFKQFASQSSYNIVYSQPAIYVQVGLSMQLPQSNGCASSQKKTIKSSKRIKSKISQSPALTETQDLLDSN